MQTTRIYATGLFIFTLAWLVSDHYPPWLSFHSEMWAFAGLFVLLANTLTCSKAPKALPLIGVWISLVALLPWLQYAAGISLFAGDALLSSMYLSGLLAALFIGYSINSSEGRLRAPSFIGLMHSLWIAAILSAAFGLTQWLNLLDFFGNFVAQASAGARAMGNLGQANQLATLLLMGMVAFSFVFERGVIGWVGFSFGIGFMTFVLILSQSRAGMVSALVLAAFLIWKNSCISSRIDPRAVAGWALCFLIGTLLLPYLNEALLLGEVRSVSALGPVSERFQMWQQIAYAVSQAPWVGYGWNQTPTAHAAGAIAFPGAVTYTNAHNFVMDMLAWNGLPVGLLLSGVTSYWFVTRIRASKRIESVYAMACLLPVAVHSMLEYPFAYAYFLIASGVMVGVVEAAMLPIRTIKVSSRLAWGFLAMWVSVGGYVAYEYFLIEEDFRVVRFENMRVGKTPEAYEIPDVWMLSHMAAMLKAARQVAQPDMPKDELENLRKASERFAYGALRFRYAQALALNGNAAQASRQMAIIRGMYGDFYYAACKEELRRLEKEKYPQFAAVLTP